MIKDSYLGVGMNSTTELNDLDLENRLLLAGEPRGGSKWFEFKEISYVEKCKVGVTDIPALIKIMLVWSDQDELDDWIDANQDERIGGLPIHAWRALGELEAGEAVEHLLDLLNSVSEFEHDDWVVEEVPQVLGLIGETAIPELVDFAADSFTTMEARGLAVQSLVYIASSEYGRCSSESRTRVVDYLVELMEDAAENPQTFDEAGLEHPDQSYELDFIGFNTAIMSGILDLDAKQAAPHIEKAFSNNQLDCGMAGDWETVRAKLEVDSLGLPMPVDPVNCVVAIQRRMEVRVLSERSLAADGNFMSVDDASLSGWPSNGGDFRTHQTPPHPKMTADEKKAFNKKRKKQLAKKLGKK